MTRTENVNNEFPAVLDSFDLQRQAMIDFANSVVQNTVNTRIESGHRTMKNRLEESIMQLCEIAKLQENWNGNGAAAFSGKIIGRALELLLSLSIQPYIFPTARDSIQMEYENKAGDYLEFELFEDGRLKMFSYTHDGEIRNGDISPSSMDGMVRDFYERSI